MKNIVFGILLVSCYLGAQSQTFDPTQDLCVQIVACMNASTYGCKVELQPGHYFCQNFFVIPNDGALPVPHQKSLTIHGAGQWVDSFGGDNYATLGAAAPTPLTLPMGTVIDMPAGKTANYMIDGWAKIQSYGSGYLEISNVTLVDSSSPTPSSCATFLWSTNTTVHVHDTSIFGALPAANACNDGIHLGGDTGAAAVTDGSHHGAFQGYGSVIRDNWFNRVRIAISSGQLGNGISIISNTIWQDSGYPGSAAIIFGGTGGNVGNTISSNVIEVGNYSMGIYLYPGVVNNTLNGNNCWDKGSSFTGCIVLEQGTFGNKVIDSVSETPSVIDRSGANKVF